MPVLTNARFTGDVGKYKLNQVVPVYLKEKEIIGSAMVVEVKPTVLIRLDGAREEREDVAFEFDDEVKARYSTFEPYYAGMTNKLCLFDREGYNQMMKQREQERERELINKLKRQIPANKYICLKCESLIAASKKPKSNKCPVCRKGTLIQ